MKYNPRRTAEWVKKPYSSRNIWEHIASIDIASAKCYEVQTQNPKPPPVHNIWKQRVYITMGIAPPLIIHALWYHFVPMDHSFHTWHPIVAFIFYYLTFLFTMYVTIKYIHYYMDLYGTFDEHSRPRDYLPDNMVNRVVVAFLIRILIRTGVVFILGGYDRNLPPSFGHTISWIFPIKIGIWLIVLDFFFYIYHRAAHTVPFLWRIHSKHHSITHPTPLEMEVATDAQSIFEHCLIPLFASITLPLSIYEHWIAQCVLVIIELTGHSGVRGYWMHPFLHEVLRPFKMELSVEDHDLHHRYGKNGLNYGKQTRIFDRLFGTICERIECMEK